MIVLAFAIGFVCVFLPFVRAYALNANLMPTTTLFDALGVGAVAALAAGALVWLATRFGPARGRRGIALVALYLLILSWFFLNFFPGIPGFLDGRGIEVAKLKYRFVFELWVIAALALSVYAFRDRLIQLMRPLCLLASAWSLVGLIPAFAAFYAAHDFDRPPVEHRFDIADPTLIQFSRSQNIILFVLDSFQSDVALKVLQRDADLRTSFDDFTFYADTAATAAKTYLSVPAILTGQAFDNGMPVRDFLDRAYLQEGSLPFRLRAEGYDSRAFLYVHTPQIPDPRLWDNLTESRATEDIANLFHLAAMAISPLPAKVFFARNLSFGQTIPDDALAGSACVAAPETATRFEAFKAQGDLVSDTNGDTALWSKLIACAQAGLEQPVFRLFHLQASHWPDFLSPRSPGAGWTAYDAYAAQVHGTLYLLADALDRLKQISVYDDATIVVVSDHGAQEYLARFDAAAFGADPAPVGETESGVMSAAMATLLVKPSAQRKSGMQISHAPVSLLDISPTLLKSAGLQADAPSLSDLTLATKRVRDFYYYVFNGWDFRYIEGFRHYSIDGPVWDPSAWSEGRDVPVPVISDVPLD